MGLNWGHVSGVLLTQLPPFLSILRDFLWHLCRVIRALSTFWKSLVQKKLVDCIASDSFPQVYLPELNFDLLVYINYIILYCTNFLNPLFSIISLILGHWPFLLLHKSTYCPLYESKKQYKTKTKVTYMYQRKRWPFSYLILICLPVVGSHHFLPPLRWYFINYPHTLGPGHLSTGCYLFIYFSLINLFIWLPLGLHCCMRTLSSCG